jgi:hypothetical protein
MNIMVRVRSSAPRTTVGRCHSSDNEPVRRPKITRAEATAIAKAEGEARGWPWIEPVAVNVGGT